MADLSTGFLAGILLSCFILPLSAVDGVELATETA